METQKLTLEQIEQSYERLEREFFQGLKDLRQANELIDSLVSLNAQPNSSLVRPRIATLCARVIVYRKSTFYSRK